MKSKVDYLRLKTLADVRTERRRIGNELDTLEERLDNDYRQVVRMFSVGYLVERVTAKAGTFYSAIEYAMSGYNFIRSLIEKYKTGAASRSEAREKTAEEATGSDL